MVEIPQKYRIPLLAAASLIGWLLLSWLTYSVWINGADHRDFFPRWAGARHLLLEGGDLYSEEATRDIQNELYGEPIPPERDQQAFAYPAQVVPLLLPFWFVADVYVASGLWAGLSAILLLWALHAARQTATPAPVWVAGLLVIWVYTVVMVFNVQFTITALAGAAIGYWAYSRERDVLAALALTFGTIKPELILLPLIAITGIAIVQRRWRFLATLTGVGLLTLLISVLVAGWWLPEWLGSIRSYTGYAATVWAPGAAWSLHPAVAIGVMGMVAALLALTRWNADRVVAASVPLGLLLLPQTLIWGLTMLLVPLVMVWDRRTAPIVVGMWLLGWVLFLTLPTGLWRVQSLLFPLLTLGIIVVVSRQDSSAE